MPKKFTGPAGGRRFGQKQEDAGLSSGVRLAGGILAGGAAVTLLYGVLGKMGGAASPSSSARPSFPKGTTGTKKRYVYPGAEGGLDTLLGKGRIPQRAGSQWTSLPKGVAYYNGPLPKRLGMGTPRQVSVVMDDILQVRTPAHFRKLIDLYGREAQAGTYIDWKAVAADWDGVEISLPAEARGLHRLDNAWYAGWDIYPRGFVWNARAVVL